MRLILSRGLPALLILVIVYAIFVRTQEDSWLFTPAVYPDGDWSIQHTYVAQDQWMKAADGSKLNGWLVPAYQPQRTVLFLHGRRGNISDQAERILRLRGLHSNVFLIDYRGYGRSQGQPSLPGIFQDGETAYAYAINTLHVPPAKLIVQGDELGSAVAAHLAAQHGDIAGLVLESPIPSIRSLANSLLPLAGLFISDRVDELTDVRQYKGPKLIIYGNADRDIPPELPERVFAAASDPKAKQLVDGANQPNLVLDSGDGYLKWMNDLYTQAKVPTPGETQAPEQVPVVPIH